MSMNPRVTTDKIRADYRDYIMSILTVRDKDITRLAQEEVRRTEFVKGPYLESTLPFVEGRSLKELVEEGLISREFEKLGKNVHYEDWHLRIHQENALRHIITERRNMVVSTGTGSGKTECYLYPVFNELMREKENGSLNPGVRALLLFPMNALANDQQKKLRKLLKDYPDITFGRYTGETAHKASKETAEEAESRLHREYDETHQFEDDPEARKSIPNELMCREKMAKTPPHILLTNYAMLEYMLLQPDTAPFFDNDSAKNWKFFVVDEAHTYKGANGTEIAYLLRRVKERIRKKRSEPFTCIATSATLGSEDGKADLARFAQNLFDEPFDEQDVITTRRMRREPSPDCRSFMPEEYVSLKADTADMTESERGKYLYEKLSRDARLFKVYEALAAKPECIEKVAEYVFDDIDSVPVRESALIDLIELSAAAKMSEYESALLPARYHLFVKSLEGMFVSLYPDKAVYMDRRETVYRNGQRTSVFELANCKKCGQEYLVGKVVGIEGKARFVQTSGETKPEYLFTTDRRPDELEKYDEDDESEEANRESKLEQFTLCLSCGKITPAAEKTDYDCCPNPDHDKLIKVYRLTYSGKGSESNCCPCCGAVQKGLIKRFLTANQPATFAVAKSLYDAIPPRPKKAAKPDADKIIEDIFGFNDTVDTGDELSDETGRKLLIFSDNRQEAAFFAGFLDKKYRLAMWRKVMLNCLKKVENHQLQMDDFIDNVRNEAEKAKLYTLSEDTGSVMTDQQKRAEAARYVMQEFISPDIGTGLEGLGYISFEPEKMQLSENLVKADLKGHEIWDALCCLMDSLRQKGAVTYPEEIRASDEFFAPRNHAGYFRKSMSENVKGDHIYGFMPSSKAVNKRIGLLLKLTDAKADDQYAQAYAKLEELYDILLQLKRYKYITETTVGNSGTVYQLNYQKWIVRYHDQNDKVCRCSKCRRTFAYNIRGICPETKCDGKIEELSAAEAQDEPYYRNLYETGKLIPMVAKEHTAQLSAKTAGDYQKDFESGKINVLSCSTTFEMGVDVGELEATFQRNVPPETSNYIQRAGRAGRRTSSAAFSVTFSRRNSHDMTFFREPEKIIAGKIKPPVLETDNDKIAERHMSSIIIAWFFRKRPEFFNNDTREIVSEQEDMASALRGELEQHPEELRQSIHAVFGDKTCEKLGVDTWNFIEYLTGKDGTLTRAIDVRKCDIDGLNKLIDECTEALKSGYSGAIKSRENQAQKLRETLTEERSINFLSANGVLPKYGFPVDSVSLDILGGSESEAKKIDLTRDLKIAISEFAPPGNVVADGKVWESYAINTIPNKGWPTYVYHECPQCRRIYPPEGRVVDVTMELKGLSPVKCRVCGMVMNARKFIIPQFGFSTKVGVKPKPVGDSKPSSYYATQIQFWGVNDLTEKEKTERTERKVNCRGEEISLMYSPGGKLFVLNQGIMGRGLNVCPTCGYTQNPTVTKKKLQHETKFGKTCASKTLLNVSLGHEFSTDIIKIVPQTKISQIGMGYDDKDKSLSVLFAILEGASKALEINRDDISGCLDEKGNIILFDNTAGGSGFVKQIFSSFEAVLEAALEKVDGSCGCSEETSCYGCLRNFNNQHFHDRLSRGLAAEYLKWLLGEDKQPVPQPVVAVKPKPALDEPETIGKKELAYTAPDTDGEPDTVSALGELLADADGETAITGVRSLLSAAGGIKTEHPLTGEQLPAKEKPIWPDIFWPASRVALFLPENRAQYDILKKYNWYCYIIDENINADRVIGHIRKGE